MKTKILLSVLLLHTSISLAQTERGLKPLVFSLDESGKSYIAFRTNAQIWTRFTDNNPGTKVYNELEPSTFDISVRRFRFKTSGSFDAKLYWDFQIGMNNLNYLSSNNPPVSLLDLSASYKFNKALFIGAGKAAWVGPSRMAAPSTSKLMVYDVTLAGISTINVFDQLLRKLMIFAHGQPGKIDYRVSISKPFAPQTSSSFSPEPLPNQSTVADKYPRMEFNTYVKYQFFEHESPTTPFNTMTYVGTKKVLALGAGLKRQREAMWILEGADTNYTNLFQWATDVFLDLPLPKGRAVTAYLGYLNYDFGKNYIRNIGANNPGQSVDPSLASFNGKGNAFPAIGTGQSLVLQLGYLFPIKESKHDKLQPYTRVQYSNFEILKDPVLVTDLGLNFFVYEHHSKFSFNWQYRPIYYSTETGIERQEFKSMYILQYQLSLH